MAPRKDDDSIDKLARLLQATGARETLVLKEFKGRFREDLPTALIFILGYEPSRAIGLLEAYRPSLVIPCYSEPPAARLKWRMKFSIDLHERFHVFDQFPRAREPQIIKTFSLHEILDKLEEIYESDLNGRVLYETHNVAISPQCSKMQAIATYLFCQSHPDVQVVFCLPGRYNPLRYSEGIGDTWVVPL
ncbi:MAG: hypothetical protein FJ291_30610 [Planctomycetes bacterium]|nr:hypothetical protein [Planctomycetota bacterium]